METAPAPADAERVLGELQPGLRVFVQGAVTEPLALRTLLSAAPDAAEGVTFAGCFLPGMNDFDYSALHPTARIATFFLQPALRRAFSAGQLELHPLSYSGIADWVARHAAFDLAVLHLTPPDPEGLCSFGPAADFGPLAWKGAKRRLGFINPLMPRPARGPTLPFAALDIAVEHAAPLIEGSDAAALTPHDMELAALAATLIPDGARLQIGIGAAPRRVLAALRDRRDLVLASGMVTPEFEDLLGAGAASRAAPHQTGIAYGPTAFYHRLCKSDAVIFADASITHSPALLAATPRFFAINSALEIDLFGQANVEFAGSELVSGVGGAPEFMRTASRCPDGAAIMVLRAETGNGGSRIVPRLTTPMLSIPRGDIDFVVTEHGIADLRYADLDARARALIEVAAPRFRVELARAWRAQRAAL